MICKHKQGRLLHDLLLLNIILIILFSLISSASASNQREILRIRIPNRQWGKIEVSTDNGISYTCVGQVTHPAVTTAEGFLASAYARNGSVAAVAIHGIRIKVNSGDSTSRDDNRTISITPIEFVEIPKGYGGHIANSSGILTDIPAGTGIFRNLAPFAGNNVYLESNGQLFPIPNDYSPAIGDVLTILVTIPETYPKEIIFENKKNGSVDAIYADKKEKIAIVDHPVTGVGRFDATGYTGLGRINTNHPGVITVSTTKLNGGEINASKETRGGFQIVPAKNAKTLDITSQIMSVIPGDNSITNDLEGVEPLFSGYINLSYDPADESKSFSVSIKTPSSDWMPFPELVGRQDNILTKLPINGEPVTFMKIKFPVITHDWIVEQVTKSALEYINISRQRTLKSGGVVTDKPFSLNMPQYDARDATYVNFYIDGSFRGISNNPPYEFHIDPSKLSAGNHIVEINAVDSNGNIIKTLEKKIFVDK